MFDVMEIVLGKQYKFRNNIMKAYKIWVQKGKPKTTKELEKFEID